MVSRLQCSVRLVKQVALLCVAHFGTWESSYKQISVPDFNVLVWNSEWGFGYLGSWIPNRRTPTLETCSL